MVALKFKETQRVMELMPKEEKQKPMDVERMLKDIYQRHLDIIHTQKEQVQKAKVKVLTWKDKDQ
jgi:hypothetical protein